MTRALSIFLLCVFVFHVGGYYIISITWRQFVRASMTERIEKERYSDSETVTFKLPFYVPYASSDRKFEAAKGEFEHGGEFYKLVKQRLDRDTLYVVAIKDVREKMIIGIMADFVKGSSDLPVPTAYKLLGAFSKDYVSTSFLTIVSSPGWHYDIPYTETALALIGQYIPVESPPPDVAVG